MPEEDHAALKGQGASKMKVLIGVFLLIPSLCYAGGESWKFRIGSLSGLGADQQTIHAIPVETGATFPLACKELVLHVRYCPRWWIPDWWRISRKDHDAALTLLENARKTSTPIRIGSMGEGFGVRPGTPCEVDSRALSIVPESDGSRAVYSYYKWP